MQHLGHFQKYSIYERTCGIWATTTTSEKMIVVARAVDEIESNSTLKARVIGALKAGGTEAFKELIDHPLVNILLASIDGWQDAE
jgi:hypothetical protein